jgi:hypothetical protein
LESDWGKLSSKKHPSESIGGEPVEGRTENEPHKRQKRDLVSQLNRPNILITTLFSGNYMLELIHIIEITEFDIAWTVYHFAIYM